MIHYELRLLLSLSDQDQLTRDFCTEILGHYEKEDLMSVKFSAMSHWKAIDIAIGFNIDFCSIFDKTLILIGKKYFVVLRQNVHFQTNIY